MKHSSLHIPRERYYALRKNEVVFQDTDRVMRNALRIVPEVASMPIVIQQVLAQVYGIIPDNPSEDVLARAMRWAFAHISLSKNMIHPDLQENQWERVIRHRLGRHEGQNDMGIYSEVALLEILLLYIMTRHKHKTEYDVYLADCLGDSDFMTDLILAQNVGENKFQMGIQLTTQGGSSKSKQNFFAKRDLHDRGLHPSQSSELVGAFLRRITCIIQVPHFRPTEASQEEGLSAILGDDPLKMFQTSIPVIHGADEVLFHPLRANAQEIGRQVFELLQFFHDGILQHVITPNIRYPHHRYEKVNDRGELISGRVFDHDGMPIFEARLTQLDSTRKVPEKYQRFVGVHRVIFSIPVTPRFVAEYYRFLSQ